MRTRPGPLDALATTCVALLLGGALGCGSGADATTPAGGAPSDGASAAPEVPQVAGQGLLETIEPQDPARPFFHDFGELIHGEDLVWTVRFRNAGAGPLKILNAQAACGCTRLDAMSVRDGDGEAPREIRSFDREVLATVPAGGELTVDIAILTAFTAANQRKLALFRLTTDSDLEPYLTLELGFLPTRPFIFAPPEARLLNTPTSHGGVARVKVLVDRKETLARVLAIESAPDGVEAELVTESFGGEFVWYVDVRVAPLAPLGVTRGDVVLRTTDRDGEGEDGRLGIPVIAQVVPDVVMGKPLITLGATASSAGAVFESDLNALVPGARLDVLETRVESPQGESISVDVAPVAPDADGRAARWTVRVTLSPGAAPGFVSGDVIFVLDEPVGGAGPDGASTELRVRLSGQIVEG